VKKKENVVEKTKADWGIDNSRGRKKKNLPQGGNHVLNQELWVGRRWSSCEETKSKLGTRWNVGQNPSSAGEQGESVFIQNHRCEKKSDKEGA